MMNPMLAVVRPPVFATYDAAWAWYETPEGQASLRVARDLMLGNSEATVVLFRVVENAEVSRAWWDLRSE